MPNSIPRKRVLTMKSRPSTLFLKFYLENIIAFYGTEAENEQVAAYASQILEVNAKMLDIDRKINILNKKIKKELNDATVDSMKQQVETLTVDFNKYKDEKKQLNDDLYQYTDTVCKTQGYVKNFIDSLKSLPCMPNAGTFKWTDCYYAFLIFHDKDYLEDDVFNPSPEKPHFHLAIRTMPCPGKRVRQVMISDWLNNIIHIKYREGIDDNLFVNQGVDVCRSFNDCVLYLLHLTEASQEDGKYPYPVDELHTNMSGEYAKQIIDGMHRLDAGMEKLTLDDWYGECDYAYKCGQAGGRFRDYLASCSFTLRTAFHENRGKVSEVREWYFKGISEYLTEHKDDFIRHAYYIEGSAKLGKTTTARKALNALGYPDDDIFDVGKGTAKFDAYKDERALICDDRGMDDIRRVTESSYCRLRKRGHGESLWFGDVVVITSNEDFLEFCTRYTLGRKCAISDCTTGEIESIKATMSRFTHFMCTEDGFIWCKSFSTREIGEKKVKQARFAKQFLEAYNDARESYLNSIPVDVTDDDLANLDLTSEDCIQSYIEKITTSTRKVYHKPDFGKGLMVGVKPEEKKDAVPFKIDCPLPEMLKKYPNCDKCPYHYHQKCCCKQEV